MLTDDFKYMRDFLHRINIFEYQGQTLYLSKQIQKMLNRENKFDMEYFHEDESMYRFSKQNKATAFFITPKGLTKIMMNERGSLPEQFITLEHILMESGHWPI